MLLRFRGNLLFKHSLIYPNKYIEIAQGVDCSNNNEIKRCGIGLAIRARIVRKHTEIWKHDNPHFTEIKYLVKLLLPIICKEACMFNELAASEKELEDRSVIFLRK